ncbi:MAG: hypothetical protein QM820_01360 [Minicystis sp.]
MSQFSSAISDPGVGEEHVGPRDAVPERRRRRPHRLLPGREAVEGVEQLGARVHQRAQLVVDGGHVLGGAVERALIGGREDERLLPEAGLAVDPRVGEDARGDDAAGEGVVRGSSVAHRISAMASAAAT